jgi:hypothetical protein
MIDTHCVDHESDTLAGEKLLERELRNATIGAADAAVRAVEYLKRAKEYDMKSKSFETTSLTGGFKKSVDKATQKLAYLPINLHVHSLHVSSPSSLKEFKKEDNVEVKWKDLMLKIPENKVSAPGAQSSTVVTAGCAAAHTLGFKKGGIRRLQRAAKILPSEKENPKSPNVFSVHQTESVRGVRAHLLTCITYVTDNLCSNTGTSREIYFGDRTSCRYCCLTSVDMCSDKHLC